MINLKKSTVDDFEDYYKIRCSHYINIWSGYKDLPNREDLYKSFIERLESRIMFIVYLSHKPIGWVYLTIDSENKEIELNYGLYENEMINGIEVINLLKQYIKNEFSNYILWNWINEINISYLKNALENGFIKKSETRRVFLPLKNKYYIQYRYEWRNGN